MLQAQTSPLPAQALATPLGLHDDPGPWYQESRYMPDVHQEQVVVLAVKLAAELIHRIG